MEPTKDLPPPEALDKRLAAKHAIELLSFLKPYRGRFIAAACALVLSTSLGLAFPYLTGLLLDAAIGDPDAAAGWQTQINSIALVLLGSLALQAAFSFFATVWFYSCGESALVDLRRSTFQRLISLPMAFFSKRPVGELSNRLTMDLTLIQDTLTMTVAQFLRQCLLMGGGVILVAFTSWRLTLLMVSTFPVLVGIAILFGRVIRRYAREAQDRMAEGGAVIEEALQGIANVKAFGNEQLEVNRYSNSLQQFLIVILKTAKLRASMVSFIIFGIFGSIVLVVWYGAHLMEAGALSVGELTRFILYTTFVGGSVASFADVYGQVQRTLGATERVRELLHEPSESFGEPAASELPIAGAVRLEAVEFEYPTRREVPVLRGVSLEAAPGEKIALVGPSGAGKSTVVAMLLRFYDPDRGRILIDGRDSREIPRAELRARMAVVPQEVLLFGGTIEENIRYGRPDASAADVIAASKRAACHDFIQRFPDGYATRVGDRGIKVSGGQRQRIAIARAFLRDPAILILDEATSALDSESEALVGQALADLLVGRTAIIIAHRLSTVRRADRIYVIEDGLVTESGSHDSLLQNADGTYRRLAQIQFADAKGGL